MRYRVYNLACMEWLKDYFASNFVLIFLSLVMLVIAIQRFRQHKRISLCTIAVITIAVLLSIASRAQEAFRVSGSLYGTLTMGIVGYVLRPLCVLLLILMSQNFMPKKYIWLTFIPAIINLIIYLFSYIPGADSVIFGYYVAPADGQLIFDGGPLRFSSHIVAALFLGFLLYISFSNLRVRHLEHGIAILICSVFVVTAVVFEVYDSGGELQLLNVTIVAGTVIYYLFLYMESTQIDTLTGLFNRETYYRDSLKMGEKASGVIQYDMNGLKYINDIFGHLEGDKALTTIARLILKSSKRNMYVYRMGGDEFIAIANSSSEAEITKSIAKFKESLSKTQYHCAVGYACRKDNKESFIDLLKRAEEKMYQDKEQFYKNSNFERRKADSI